MRPSTLFLMTFVLWLAAKKRLGTYWELATTNNGAIAAPSGASATVGPGSDLSHASALPGFSTGQPMPPYYTGQPSATINRTLDPLPPLTELD